MSGTALPLRASVPRARPGPVALAAGGLALLSGAAAATALAWAQDLPAAAWLPALLRPDPHDAAALLFRDGVLPRSAVAALCGAGLALAGALTQDAIGNPLAVPGTLGVTSGAQLAMLLTGLFLPASLGLPAGVAALCGGALSLAAVFGVGATGRFSALLLVLAGLCVSLFCAAVAGALSLLNHEAVGAVSLWAAGSLAQDGWRAVIVLATAVAGFALVAAVLARPLALLGLPDASVRALGLSPAALRLAVLAVAVGIAASVTATVGPIGFVDLAAPVLVRLGGARRPAPRLIGASLVGAVLMLLIDSLIQAVENAVGAFMPTGAVTALLAAPLLLALLPRLRGGVQAADAARHLVHPRARRPIVAWLALVSLVAAVAALLIGRTALGWAIMGPDSAAMLLPWRAPRTGAAFAAGAALGSAGALLQRALGNPLAAPESLGVGAAALASTAVAMVLLPGAPAVIVTSAGTLGAVTSLALLLAMGLRARFAPEHLLLAGITLNAALAAAVTALLALNDSRAAALAAALAGSTAAVDGPSALLGLGLVALAVPLALLLARPLDLMALSEATARAAGVRPLLTRGLAVLLAGGLTAGAVPLVGPFTFVGLLGPHLALRLGLTRSVRHLPGSALAGGLVLAVADWAGRIVDAPFEVPAGLSASLLGIPVLLILLARGAKPA